MTSKKVNNLMTIRLGFCKLLDSPIERPESLNPNVLLMHRFLTFSGSWILSNIRYNHEPLFHPQKTKQFFFYWQYYDLVTYIVANNYVRDKWFFWFDAYHRFYDLVFIVTNEEIPDSQRYIAMANRIENVIAPFTACK